LQACRRAVYACIVHDNGAFIQILQRQSVRSCRRRCPAFVM
jgi:hypothetical protein